MNSNIEKFSKGLITRREVFRGFVAAKQSRDFENSLYLGIFHKIKKLKRID